MKLYQMIASTFAALAVMVASIVTTPVKAADEIVVGFIGSFASDTGKSTLRGAEIAIDELNAAGGVMGKQIKLVKADIATIDQPTP